MTFLLEGLAYSLCIRMYISLSRNTHDLPTLGETDVRPEASCPAATAKISKPLLKMSHRGLVIIQVIVISSNYYTILICICAPMIGV